MQLKRLDRTFFPDHTHLRNALDLYDGTWDSGKIRGYGFVVIKINKNLTFAIPKRSRIRQKRAFITKRSREKGVYGKGLDYSKALLITRSSYIFHSPFKIAYDEHKKIMNSGSQIRTEFEEYVNDYIGAVRSGDQNLLDSKEFQFTTLVNYHTELGI